MTNQGEASVSVPREATQAASVARGSVSPPRSVATDAAHSESTHSESTHSDPAHTEPAHTDPAQSATTNRRTPRAAGFASLRYAVITCTILACLVATYFARSLLFPVLSAMLLALLLAPAVAGLKRLRIPEPAGAAIVMTMMVATLAGLATYLSEPAARWADIGPAELRELRGKLKRLWEPVQTVVGATDKMAAMAEDPARSRPREVVVAQPQLWKSLGDMQVWVAGGISILILLYFLLASGDIFLRKLIRVVPALTDKKRAVSIARDIQAEIGTYFISITLINLSLGIATTLVMMAFGMPTPALVGSAVAVLNFLPYIGPAIAVAAITVLAALTFDELGSILLPPGVFLAMIVVEGQFLQPIFLGRRLALNPVALFVWLLLWGWLWGLAGLVLAVPLLVALRVAAAHVESLGVLNEFLARD